MREKISIDPDLGLPIFVPDFLSFLKLMLMTVVNVFLFSGKENYSYLEVFLYHLLNEWERKALASSNK
jgi:hypothetical protein